MNLDLRVVSYYLGLMLLILSAAILSVALFAGVEHLVGGPADTSDLRALFLAAFGGAVFAVALMRGGRRAVDLLGQREALLLVALGWLVGAAIGALPFRIWASLRMDAAVTGHSFDSYINCYFETMSGLTTTGATVLQAIGTLPRSLLLWRALTHWLGGLGIVVLFVAVLPMLGVGGRRVYRIEAPGPTPEGVKPRIQDTARTLWLIYLGMTLLETLALRICGMDWFNAVCHTFATLATGGFSTHDSSIGGFESTAIRVVIIIFMVLAGVNFGLYHQLLQRQWRSVRKDPELRAYFAILAIAAFIVTVSLLQSGQLSPSTDAAMSTGAALQEGVFQVVSMQTTTGFCTADFDGWGFAAKATLLVLMFIGASAGSTGGGIKVVRIMIAVKVVLAELEHVYRRKVVRSLKIGKSTIDPELKLNTLVYVVSIAVLFGVGTMALMVFESHQDIDITTAATASAATLNNIGPGLGKVGASQNYGWFSKPSKVVMSMLMVLGRLEVFTIMALFTPRFWLRE